MSRTERIRAHDGARFPGHLALPDVGSGPGLVVVQEIFGVNGYIKSVCERLAKLGYVALSALSSTFETFRRWRLAGQASSASVSVAVSHTWSPQCPTQ